MRMSSFYNPQKDIIKFIALMISFLSTTDNLLNFTNLSVFLSKPQHFIKLYVIINTYKGVLFMKIQGTPEEMEQAKNWWADQKKRIDEEYKEARKKDPNAKKR